MPINSSSACIDVSRAHLLVHREGNRLTREVIKTTRCVIEQSRMALTCADELLDSSCDLKWAKKKSQLGYSSPSVLLVEDECLIAEELALAFQEAGATVIGPATDVASALQLITNSKLDGAVLDVNLRGSLVFPVSEALVARGIPFVFTSGYSELSEIQKYKGMQLFLKPYFAQDVISAVLRLIPRYSQGFAVTANEALLSGVAMLEF